MEIHVRTTCLYDQHSNRDVIKGNFTFIVNVDQQLIHIQIDGGKRKIVASCTCTPSDQLAELLQSGDLPINKWPEPLVQERDIIAASLLSGSQRVIDAIKYHLNRSDINEDWKSLPSIEWSKDGELWAKLPLKTTSFVVFEETLEINECQEPLQQYLDRNEESFFAMRHLHRAKRETNPRYMWIDATIAAELAAKEFYIRLIPDLAEMLVELPSPPLDKLYGRLLKAYAGQESPVLKQLKDGMSVRNMLIHRPGGYEISQHQAAAYLDAVQVAIFHLQKLLNQKSRNSSDSIVEWHLEHRPHTFGPSQTVKSA